MTAPLWPFAPAGEVVARLSWLSDVIGAYSAEQRMGFRVAPRLTVSLSAELRDDDAELARFIAEQSAEAGGMLRLPDWRYAAPVAVSSGAFDHPAPALFTVDGEALVWISRDSNAVAAVSGISGSTITTGGGAPDGLAFAVPVREVVLLGGVDITPTGYGLARASIECVETGYPDLREAGSPALELEGFEVFDAPKYRTGSLTERIFRPAEYVDNGTGPIVPEWTREYIEGAVSLSVEDLAAADQFERELFFHRRAGRRVPFFLATGTRDYVILSGGGSSVTVAARGDASLYEGRRVLAHMIDGTAAAATVTGASAVSGGVALSLSPSLPAGGVATLSRLSLCRLASDDVETRIAQDGSATTGANAVRIDYEL